MCWSKHEREQWERERREAELEAEPIRRVSREPVSEKPAPEIDADERRGRVVRADAFEHSQRNGRPPKGGRLC
jgi:hypothetical protein